MGPLAVTIFIAVSFSLYGFRTEPCSVCSGRLSIHLHLTLIALEPRNWQCWVDLLADYIYLSIRPR